MKKNNLVWIIFLVVGAFFTIIGLFIVQNNYNYDNKIETTAIITRIVPDGSVYEDDDTNYDVYVSYTIDGIKYETKLNGYSSNFYEGKKIDIYYDKDNPQKIGMKSLDLLFLIFPGLGFTIMIVGLSGLIAQIKSKSDEKKLRENGRLIYARYLKTVINESYAVNGQHPYNIICEYQNSEDGQNYELKSKNIWENPENIIVERNITNFPVYINPHNKKQYFIDVDSLIRDLDAKL